MRVLMRERVGKSGGSTAGIADVHKPRTLAKLHGLENADDLEQGLQAPPAMGIPAYGRWHVLRGFVESKHRREATESTPLHA